MSEKLNPGQYEERCRELEGTHKRSEDPGVIEYKSKSETIRFHWDGGDGYTEEVIKAKKK